MTILRYEPWSLVNRLHRHLDEAFSADTGESDGAWWIPQVDVHEEPERFADHFEVGELLRHRDP